MAADEPCTWDINTDCVPGWDELDPLVQLNATAWASYILWSLTGRQFGLCPITVRPCYQRCGERSYRTYGVWMDSLFGGGRSWVPWIDSGEWRNCGCAGICCCGASCEVWLPGPVASVTSVVIDGVTLPLGDPPAYRIDNGDLLVRQDGECWPYCQDFDAPPGAADTFSVTYVQGSELPFAGKVAAGYLAGEFVKSCLGQACGIPDRVTSVQRSGVSFELVSATDEFDQGLTGITEVDRFIRAANPNQLSMAPTVTSPDLHYPRAQTWP